MLESCNFTVFGLHSAFLLLFPLILLTLAESTHSQQDLKLAAQNGSACSKPSSCGNINNIIAPFRLSTDPSECGDRDYELVCTENNRTILNLSSILTTPEASQLFSGKYLYVVYINYKGLTLGVVDPGIHRGNYSSLPLLSLASLDYWTSNFSYWPSQWHSYGISYSSTEAVTFFRCAAQVKNSSRLYVEASSSGDGEASSSGTRGPPYSYVVYGDFFGSDLEESCTIGTQTYVGQTIDIDAHSFTSLHDAMATGFELSWMEYCERSLNYDGCPSTSPSDPRPGLSESLREFLSLVLPNFIRWLMGLNYDGSFANGYLQSPWDSGKTFHIPLGVWLWGKCIIRAEGVFWGAKILIGYPCLLVFLIYKFRRRHLSMDGNIEDFLQNQSNLMPISYSYSEIKKMTNKFRDKLGEGGYGSVYKGKLRSRSNVAVKILENTKANDQELINEITTIGRIHHINIVHLIGFCVERSKHALVYDFMSNGSLDKHIFGQDGNFSISWKKLYEISLGVARGIEYLHRGCDMQILHFDIKPHNILLDDNLVPKISDFGLAKLYSFDDSIVSLTTPRGTMGYMAPELFYKNIGGVSYKADVYSYGMLLMEIAGRRKIFNVSADNLSQWVYDQLDGGKDMQIEGTTKEERKILKKMMIVALWCVQMKPGHRPSMSKVVKMLEGSVEVQEIPPKPFLSPHELPSKVTRFNNIGNLPELGSPSDDQKYCINLKVNEDDITEN